MKKKLLQTLCKLQIKKSRVGDFSSSQKLGRVGKPETLRGFFPWPNQRERENLCMKHGDINFMSAYSS
jgi:hypothetical protein